jgi:hypothetical protein
MIVILDARDMWDIGYGICYISCELEHTWKEAVVAYSVMLS